MKLRTFLGILITLLSANSFSSQEEMYYDPVSGKFVTEDELGSLNENEFILTTRIERADFGELLVIEKDGLYWADLEATLEILDFPIDLTYEINQEDELTNFSGEGWFIRENNLFSLELDKESSIYLIQSKNKTFYLNPENIWVNNNTLYLPINQALSWFEIESKINSSSLLLELFSATRLPIQDRFGRLSRSGSGLNKDIATQYPREDIPYRLLGPIFTDVNLSARHNRNKDNTYNFSLAGAGDLAYMTGRYFISSQYDDNTKKTTNKYRLYLERNDLDSSLLGPLQASHISFGDINTASIQNLPSGGADVGVRVSNRPYGRITNSATTNFSGFQQPDWEVELYHDDIFIESVVVQADGMYQFLDVPLNAGENIFKLKFYGPQGQEEEKVEIRNLDQASLVGGDWIYDFSVSKQNTSLANILEGKNTYEDDQYRVNLHLEKGIGNNFSLTADYTNYDFDDGTNHNFIQAGARFYLLNTVFNLNHLRDLDAGGLSSFSLSRRLGPNSNHSFSYSARHESEDFAVNSYSSSNFKLNQNANLSGPLTSYPGFRSRYSLGTSWSENYDGNTSQNYNLGLAATIYRWSLSNNLYASKARRHGDFRLGTYYGRLNLRAGLTYDLKPESELDSGNVHLGWTFSNDLRVNYDYGYKFTTSADSHRVNLSWFNKYFVTSFSVARDSEGIVTGGLHVKFSLVPDPLRNRLHMSSRGLANTGAVSALVFEDLNNNQVWDEGEPIIENAEVVGVQQRKRDFTDKDGKAFVTGLSPTIPVDIEVNTDSLEDPFWMPSKEGVSFLPRAGLIKTVHIPIVTGGEIEGKVIYRTDITHSGVEQGGIPLLLTNTASGETLETQTVFDGYFLLDKVKPGNYLLTINQNYLQKNKLATRSPMPLTIGNNGSLIMGANFEVFPADLYQAKPEEVFENEAFWVDLGAFSSENNAKTVANALRLVFSRILSLRSSPKPVEMVLAKDSAEMYQLKLGPLTNINDSKEICGALVQEGLYCKVEKIDLDLKTPNKPASSITPTTKLANPPTQSTSPSNENRPDDKTAILAKGLEWVKTQNSSSYTLQLSNSLNYEGAKYSLDQLKSNTAYIIEQKNNNQITYSLILGSFPTREDAIMQASNLSFNTPPWIRSFEGLKENLIESQ